MNSPAHQLQAMTGPQQSTALARVVRLARGITTQTLAAGGLVFILQSTLPVGIRPSDFIGDTHGSIEAADANAKREAIVELDRRRAEEVSREQAKVQAEIVILQQQMNTLAESMTAKSGMANIADVTCIFGQIVTSNARDYNTRNTGATLRGACGYGDALRNEQQEAYQRLARNYSALIARDDALHRQAVEMRLRMK